MATPRKTRSQGPAEEIDLDHPTGKGTKWLPNEEEEIAFYMSYHSNRINKLIHLVFIPAITWTTLILTAHYFPLPGSKLTVISKGFAYQPSVALALAVGYQIWYTLFDPLDALTFLPWTVLLYLTGTYVAHYPYTWMPWQKTPTAIPFTWALFTSSWIFQFIGHVVFEKRAPALFQSFHQAFISAPFFVHLEVMFYLFNWKPEMQKRLKNKVGTRIRELRRADKSD